MAPNDDPGDRQIRVQAERASGFYGARDRFGFELQFLLAGLFCTTKCFKDGTEICGDPIYSHGFAWYILAKYDGADNDNGDVDIGVELMPNKARLSSSSSFSPVRCVGTMSVGNADQDIDVDVARVQSTTFYLFAKIPLKVINKGFSRVNPLRFQKLLDHVRLDKSFAVIVAVTVTDKKRKPDAKRIAANLRASLGVTQGR